ncbi:MAG: hypothetical protein O2955_05895 [Planctomycetota bacterium]|nr:hypothetical protein [Planctomycetota bacterium]MDA1212026.1 hypothetical protein [Planctomycetota bacterium]
MRLRRWLTPLFSACLVATIGQGTWAQSTPNSSDSDEGRAQVSAPGEFISGVPAMQYGTVGYPQSRSMTPADSAWASWGQPVAEGYPPPGPGGASQYPNPGMYWPGDGQVPSPFASRFSQHTNSDGLWQFESNNRPNQYFFGLEYLSTRNKRPTKKALVGNPQSVTYFQMVQDSITEIDDELADQFENFGFNYYDAQSVGIHKEIKSPGMRGRWGFIRPDDSGFVLEGWWAVDQTDTWDAATLGSSRRQDPSEMADLFALLSAPDYLTTDVFPNTADEILQQNLLNLRGLPVDDGSHGGITIPYDLGYKLKVSSESFGAAANILTTPMMKTNTFMLRPLWGVRYLNIQEGFTFIGQDSGLLYDDNADTTDPATPDLKLQSLPNYADTDGDGIVDNAGIVEGIVEPDDSGSDGGQDIENITDEVGFRIITDPYTAYLSNTVRTNLAGPEIGVRYDLGGSKLLIWGQSKVGLMGNNEKLAMRGDNIGMATRGDLLEATPDNPHPNRFFGNDEHSHVSPIFEQGLFAEMNIFGDIPLLDEIYFLQEAKLKFGVTYIVAGAIARPYNNIVWKGNPQEGLFPLLRVDRETWSTLNWSVGIDWAY